MQIDLMLPCTNFVSSIFADSLRRADKNCVLLSLFLFIVMQLKTVVCPTYVQLINLHVLTILNLCTFQLRLTMNNEAKTNTFTGFHEYSTRTYSLANYSKLAAF